MGDLGVLFEEEKDRLRANPYKDDRLPYMS